MPDSPISGLPLSDPIDGTEELAVVQGGVTKRTTSNSVGVQTNPTTEYLPINNGGEFSDSPIRLEGGVLVSSVTIQTPPASVLIGSNVRVTDSGSGVGYSLESTGSTYEIAGSLYDEAIGTEVGLAVTDYTAAAFQIPTQNSDAITNSYENYTWEAQIFSKEQDPINGADEDLFRIYRVSIRGGAGPQAPVRLRIYFEDPDLNPNADPFYDNVDTSGEPAWLEGNAGFVLQDGVDTIIEFKQGQRLRVGLKFWIQYSVPSGEQFTVKGDNVDIGFGTVFVPYQISTIMPGYEIDVAPPRDRATLQTIGNTWTTIITHPVATDTTENVTFNTYGVQDGGSGIMSAELVATVINASGVTTEIGDTITYRHRSGGIPNFRAQADGIGNLLLQVRGTGGDTWDWRGLAQTREQKL